jgi:putative iron-only hydrogenase system regulator
MSIETRVAVISIIVENEDAAQKINEILHEYRNYVIGRMGIPYRDKGISIISVAVDAPQEKISALSGRIGRLPGISAKTAYSNVITQTELK